MSYLPCTNPNCPSYGRPHPNCKCHLGMAEGGEVIAPDDVEMETPIDPEDVEITEAPQQEKVDPEFAPTAPGGGERPPEEVAPGTTIDPNDVELIAEEPDQEPIDPDDVEIENPGMFPRSLDDVAKGRYGLFPTPERKLDGEKMTDEDIQAMHKSYEDAFSIGSLLTGGGVFKVAGIGANAAANTANLGKAGSAILRGAIANGLVQGTDEVSKWMMGEASDHPVAATIIASGLGGLISLGGSAAVNKFASEARIGNKVSSFLAGIASGAKNATGEAAGALPAEIDKVAHAAGVDMFKAIAGVGKVGGAAGEGYREYKDKGPVGAVTGALKGYGLAKALGFASKNALAPIILKVLSSGAATKLGDVLSHIDKVETGVNLLTTLIDRTFQGVALGADKIISNAEKELKRKKLEEYLDEGGIDETIKNTLEGVHIPEDVPGFAKGGEVKDAHGDESGLAQHFPEQNMVANAAKARASNYLNSLRPAKFHPKLAFDTEPDTSAQKKTYHKALDIAVSPLSVMDEVQKGTITPEHIKHLDAMFPEVRNLMQKKVTERITQAQLKGEKPSYKVRQGLSLLLGAPLSGEMLPQNIQAAQAVFTNGKSAREPQAKKQASPSSASLSNSDKQFLTDDQARESRQKMVR